MGYLDSILQQKYELSEEKGKTPTTLEIGESVFIDVLKELDMPTTRLPVSLFGLKIVLTKSDTVKVK